LPLARMLVCSLRSFTVTSDNWMRSDDSSNVAASARNSFTLSSSGTTVGPKSTTNTTRTLLLTAHTYCGDIVGLDDVGGVDGCGVGDRVPGMFDMGISYIFAELIRFEYFWDDDGMM